LAPDWTLEDPAGEPLNFYTDARDNVSVVLFWATWCPYCRTLMPHLQDVADEFDDRPVRFYALNVWEDGDPLRYMEENGFSFRLLMLADLVAEDWGVKGTPGLFVVGPSRRILYRRSSGEDDAAVSRAVRRAIGNALRTRP